MLFFSRTHNFGANMSRQLSIAVLCLGLFGCDSIPGLESDNAATPSGTPQRDNSCAAVAQQRAQDAGYNGYDRDMQQRIYEYTYADCMAERKNNHD